MKLSVKIILFFTIFALPVFAQTVDPCTQNTKLTGGIELAMEGHQGMRPLEGTPYHYEMWVDERGAQSITLTSIFRLPKKTSLAASKISNKILN